MHIQLVMHHHCPPSPPHPHHDPSQSTVYCKRVSDAGNVGDARTPSSPIAFPITIICHHLPSSSSSPSSPSLSSQKCEGDLVLPKNIAASPPGYIPRSSPCTRSHPPKLCLADNIGCHVPRVKEGGEK